MIISRNFNYLFILFIQLIIGCQFAYSQTTDNSAFKKCTTVQNSISIKNTFKIHFDEETEILSLKEDLLLKYNYYKSGYPKVRIWDITVLCSNSLNPNQYIISVTFPIKSADFTFEQSVSLYYLFDTQTFKISKLPFNTSNNELSIMYGNIRSYYEFYFGSTDSLILGVKMGGLLAAPIFSVIDYNYLNSQEVYNFEFPKTDTDLYLIDYKINKSENLNQFIIRGLYVRYETQIYNLAYGVGGFTYFSKIDYYSLDYSLDLKTGEVKLFERKLIGNYVTDDKFKNGYSENTKHDMSSFHVFKQPNWLFFRGLGNYPGLTMW